MHRCCFVTAHLHCGEHADSQFYKIFRRALSWMTVVLDPLALPLRSMRSLSSANTLEACLIVPLQEGVPIHADIAVLDGQLFHQLLSFSHLILIRLCKGCADQILVHLWPADVIGKAQVQHVHARRRQLHATEHLSIVTKDTPLLSSARLNC